MCERLADTSEEENVAKNSILDHLHYFHSSRRGIQHKIDLLNILCFMIFKLCNKKIKVNFTVVFEAMFGGFVDGD